MSVKLLDTHAHLIADDWDIYRARPFTPDLPIPDRPDFTVTAEQLLALMDAHGVDHACLVQRGRRGAAIVERQGAGCVNGPPTALLRRQRSPALPRDVATGLSTRMRQLDARHGAL